jgi:putative acetyltransferase
MLMLIRTEEKKDEANVYDIIFSAFESQSEAKLVCELRKTVKSCISIVAEEKFTIVGHILFTPVLLSGNSDIKIAGLAPLAVSPTHQCTGIGSKLVGVGLDRCKDQGFVAVVVLGDPNYYHRFGFSSSSKFGIDCEYNVPEGFFMAVELEPSALVGRSGMVKYHKAFESL